VALGFELIPVVTKVIGSAFLCGHFWVQIWLYEDSLLKYIIKLGECSVTKRPSTPIFKIISGPSPTMKGASEAASGGISPLISALSTAADLAPMDDEQLYGFLHFRVLSAKRAEDRSGWFGGRLYNKFSGESPNYIPLSGTQLRQAFQAAGIQPPDFVVAAGKYELRLDYAHKAYDALRASAETEIL